MSAAETSSASRASAAVSQNVMLSWVRDIAPYGIFTTDADLVIREWNQWLATHSGLAAAAVVGRRLVQVFPDVAHRRLDEHFHRALRGEVAVLSTALHRYLLPFPPPVRENDIDRMLQTARIAPLPADDQIVGTITIIEDVTQRECHAAVLRRQQEYDRLLSDALAVLLHSTHPAQSMAEIFPRIAAPLKLDVYFNFLFAGSDVLRLQGAGGVTPEVKRALAVLPTSASFCGDVVRHRRPRLEANVQANTTPLAEMARRLGLNSYAVFPLVIGERVLGTLAFGSYVRPQIAPEEAEFLGKLTQYVAIALERAQREHALTEAQAKLSRHAGELEVKIAERTAKLHETIVHLESFSYTIAHDLRAPIRSLNGYTDILLHDFGPNVPESAQDLLRRLQRASLRLDALTRDLLRFSRVTREELQLEVLSVDELVREVVHLTPALQDGVLSVDGSLGKVWGQRTLLQQCFANLFDNAVKFAVPGETPRIQVRAEPIAPRDDPHDPNLLANVPRVRISVIDQGIGIAPESHRRIFGIFERVDGSQAVEGTGIGLAIVERAMQRMSGRCGVESTLGAGSRFWLELVAADAPRPSPTSAPSTRVSL